MDADGLVRGRRGAFNTAGLMWQVWRFQYLHRCPRKLGDEGGPMDADCLLCGRRDAFSSSGLICVAGVALAVPS